MALLDYSNLNLNYFSNNQITNPFYHFDNYDYDNYNYDYGNGDCFPTEAELLCIDPLPPSLFDFDFDASLFDPPPPPPPQPDHHHHHLHLQHYQPDYLDYELIVPENLEYYYYPSTPLHLTTEDHNNNYLLEEASFSSGDFFPFPKKQKLSVPQFNPFSSEIYGVSQCGAVENYSNYQNVGGVVGEFDGGCGGGGKVKSKEVTAQSRAARERRKKIAEKTQELGKLVPGGTKMNTAEMFQAAYNYVLFLQAQLRVLDPIKTLPEESENEVNLNNLPILGSQLVQEKLFAKEKCLVPKDLLPKLKKQLDSETDPFVSKQIDELLA